MAWIRADSAVATAGPGLPVGWLEADRAIATAEPGIAEAWVKADSRFATIEPSVAVNGWIEADSRTAVVNPSGVPVCTPGEIKCVGYDLYTCSLASQWELTKHNATECDYVPEEEEKPFPWLWVGIGSGIAALIGIIASVVKKKR